jgi:hypothetical protein
MINKCGCAKSFDKFLVLLGIIHDCAPDGVRPDGLSVSGQFLPDSVFTPVVYS